MVDNHNNDEFPSEEHHPDMFPEDSDEGINLFKDVISWGELTHQNTWLRILESHHAQTVNGPGFIMELKTRDGSTVKALTTKTIAESVRSCDERKCGRNIFIKSKGLQKAKNTGRQYYDFELKLF